ncbi:hypothetical protein Psuf_000530 [Phytohabitans suffuscus]|uniref:PKS/mFAS DH domain-containing protein n=1 Tax=Phytohabitans suffuscus TaxID=624315 RepID=A0A6F8Y9K6_9ACTN|nr:SDR family NAD(P)-dependent oxidoreductase [Phytohabitans suffuscus]BCB82740.1 hypothetical protein Psuf_000530 [Phytohabitans suffuscus]
MLPVVVELADGSVVLSGRVSATSRGWLDEHAAGGVRLLPGAALLEWVLHAADVAGCAGVEELVLRAPLVLPDRGGLRLQVFVGADEGGGGRRPVQVLSCMDGGSRWLTHAEGVLTGESGEAEALTGSWPPPEAEPVPLDGFYERADQAGYGYGPSFQGLRAAWRAGADLYAEVTLPEAAGDPDGFGIHPALLDAALHPLLPLAGDGTGGRLWLPFAWSGVSLWATGASTVRVHLTRDGERSARVVVADPTGAPVLTCESLESRPLDTAGLAAAAVTEVDGLYHLEWAPATEPREPASGQEVVDVPAGGDALPVVAAALARMRQWVDGTPEGRLVFVTHGAVDTEGGTFSAGDDLDQPGVDLAGAAVWGLVRSGLVEHPGRFGVLDVDGGGPVATGEEQAVVRGGRVLVPRLAPADGGMAVPAGGGWRLDAGGSGVDGVRPVACPEVLDELAPGQVRVAVHAAGLNFRDVLVSLGALPGHTGLGGEGAGVVLDVGEAVTQLAVGDRVFGMFPGAFGPVAVTDGRWLARMPAGWSFVQAAAVPVAFLTAWYGLSDLAGLRRGQRLLIHAATGGVGLAAVQIARHLGAEIFATASAAKHDTLRSLGIDEAHRASSRDLTFETVLRPATEGRGMDVVLDCLAGDFVDAGLRLTAPGGLFLEMGKTDIRDPEQVAAAYPGLTYRAFDLLSGAGPDRVQAMLGELLALFDAGALRPPPVRQWPVTHARQALRHLSQARHIGKLVLTVPQPSDPDGAVLVTGGTGALGAELAEHLARAGRRRLVLASRRGEDAPGAKELAERLAALGAEVTLSATDVTDADALRALVDGIPRLSEVVHAAGVLDDAVLTAQTPEALERVWRTKAHAAWRLHELSRHLPLTAFTVFSSSAATLGAAGQANYAAANAYCDALAVRRRQLGLPGLSIGWGLWGPPAAWRTSTPPTGRAWPATASSRWRPPTRWPCTTPASASRPRTCSP